MTAGATKARRRAVRVALAAGVVAVLAACNPVPHPTTTTREAKTSSVTFRLLAAGGRYAVVTATGPSATVPGAGHWRVDRYTGGAVALPAGLQPLAISADGTRVRLEDNSLWTDSGTFVPPVGAEYSQDLSAIVYVSGGVIKARRFPSGAEWDVEGGHPRPAGTTGVSPVDVADSGRVVQYALAGVQTMRFVDLDAGTAVDRPNLGYDIGFEWERHRFALAADGSRFAVHYEQGASNPEVGIQILQSTLELVDADTGTTVGSWVGTGNWPTTHLLIGSTGEVAWIHQRFWQSAPGYCPGSPTYAVCVVDTRAVSVTPAGSRTWPIGGNDARAVSASRNGRFLLVETFTNPFQQRSRLTALDWKAGTSEALSAGTFTEYDGLNCRFAYGPMATAPCTLPVGARSAAITDDFKVIAAAAGGTAESGWFELTNP
jgi:hypothetical protein